MKIVFFIFCSMFVLSLKSQTVVNAILQSEYGTSIKKGLKHGHNIFMQNYDHTMNGSMSFIGYEKKFGIYFIGIYDRNHPGLICAGAVYNHHSDGVYYEVGVGPGLIQNHLICNLHFYFTTALNQNVSNKIEAYADISERSYYKIFATYTVTKFFSVGLQSQTHQISGARLQFTPITKIGIWTASDFKKMAVGIGYITNIPFNGKPMYLRKRYNPYKCPF